MFWKKKKQIIHFQIPLHDGKISIQRDIAIKFIEIIKERIEKDYEIIFSPFIPSSLISKKNFSNFDMGNLSVEDLREILDWKNRS